jgi:protein SCO1/2
LTVFLILSSITAAAQAPDSILNQIAFDQRIGYAISGTVSFRDESGSPVTLDAYLNHNRPIILTPVYYECPMLCSMLLNGIVKTLRVTPLTPGKDFDIISFSIDPNERPDQAATRKQHYIRDYGKPQAAAGWHFLTGDATSIHALTDAIGFRYAYDNAVNQWAHASGIVILTPEGTISQYFYGLEFDPGDLTRALTQASNHKTGSFVERVLLYCFEYNASTGKYTLSIMRVLRAGGIATVLMIAAFWIFESRRRRWA